MSMQHEWPIRDYESVRPGSHVLNLGGGGMVWYKPTEDLSGWERETLWDQLMRWLVDSPPLVDIQTFWVNDDRRGPELLVTGMPAKENP